jgi:hypothetical protein
MKSVLRFYGRHIPFSILPRQQLIQIQDVAPDLLILLYLRLAWPEPPLFRRRGLLGLWRTVVVAVC